MKKILTTATLTITGFISLNLRADEAIKPYIIQRDDEVIEVYPLPTFTISEPISNSFVYVDGEYVNYPYVVSVSNLTVYINERIIQDYEPWVHNPDPDLQLGRVGNTPWSIGRSIDYHCNSIVTSLTRGSTLQYYSGGEQSSGMDDGSGALARIALARKAVNGDEQAKQQLIEGMGLENSLSRVHPDWIERLATNTNLEVRATAIMEAKKKP